MGFKKYVEVIAKFSEDNKIIPLKILWDDGRQFDIDKVVDIRKAASLKAGGVGIRYTCRINGNNKHLWLEENKWFVELKLPE